MRLPFLSRRRREYLVAPLVPGQAAQVAAIHAEDFARPWTDGEFEALLSQDAVFGFAAREVGKARSGLAGFVLARLAADEAEILTIAVGRGHRRFGVGRALMEATLRELHGERARRLFLEVDENNLAALSLYRRLGFEQVATRPAYYRDKQGRPAVALVMRRDLD